MLDLIFNKVRIVMWDKLSFSIHIKHKKSYFYIYDTFALI